MPVQDHIRYLKHPNLDPWTHGLSGRTDCNVLQSVEVETETGLANVREIAKVEGPRCPEPSAQT